MLHLDKIRSLFRQIVWVQKIIDFILGKVFYVKILLIPSLAFLLFWCLVICTAFTNVIILSCLPLTLLPFLFYIFERYFSLSFRRFLGFLLLCFRFHLCWLFGHNHKLVRILIGISEFALLARSILFLLWRNKTVYVSIYGLYHRWPVIREDITNFHHLAVFHLMSQLWWSWWDFIPITRFSTFLTGVDELLLEVVYDWLWPLKAWYFEQKFWAVDILFASWYV